MILRHSAERWIGIGAAGVALTLLGAGGGCAATGPAAGEVAPAPGRINHVVFFELEDPAEADALIADSLKLGAIPGVSSCYAGRHLDTGRDSVLDDYDVGFFVAFDSEDDYAVYVAHPDHVALVEKWRPRLRALRVYDVLDLREKQ